MSLTCAELGRLDDCYLDDELLPEEREEVDRHLAGCEACRAEVAAARHLRSVVRAQAPRPTAPPALRARVLASLDAVDQERDQEQGQADELQRVRTAAITRRSRLRGLVPHVTVFVAAAGLAMVGGRFLTSARGERISAEDTIATHAQNLPLEIKGGEEQVASFLAGRVPVRVKPPRLPARTASLEGARLSHVRGRDAAQLYYQVDRAPMTVTVFDAADVDLTGFQRIKLGRHDAWAAALRGYNVVVVRHEGVAYAFTSALDQGRMRDLATVSFEP